MLSIDHTGVSLPSLLFESDVSEVAVIDTDNTVVLLEEALLLGFASALQTFDQKAQSPAKVNITTSVSSCMFQ